MSEPTRPETLERNLKTVATILSCGHHFMVGSIYDGLQRAYDAGVADARRELAQRMLDKMARLTWLLQNEQYSKAATAAQSEIDNIAGELQSLLEAGHD